MAVVRARTHDARTDAFDVRQRVFVDEQRVEEALEFDEMDTAGSTDHFVVYADGTPIGAARLRPIRERSDRGKIERVAILPSWRGDGWGTRLMDALHERAWERGFDTVVVHAQLRVTGFYTSLGYSVTGESFDEAGIPHVKMRRSVWTQ